MNRLQRFLVNYAPPWLAAACIIAVAFSCAMARGADKPIDSAVALAWAQPAKPDRVTATDGKTYEKGADGYYRAVASAPVVAPTTFRTGQYNASHRCNACGFQSPAGTGTWIVRGHNADGTHNHSCPNCGNTWRH